MRFAKTIASASVAAVLGLAGVSVAGAASSDGSSPTTGSTPTTSVGAPARNGATNHAGRAKLRRRLARRAGVLAARTIGIQPSQLASELKAGKTIAEVATEHGVQPQAVIDAIEQAAQARIQQALDAGKITPERAARLRQRVDTIVPKLVNNRHGHKPAA